MSEIIDQLAAVLRCNAKSVPLRVARLKIGAVCSRCCGSGEYSFNQIDGSRCYGCGGAGQIFPKAKKAQLEVLEEAKRAAADGRLAHYLEGIAAGKEAKSGVDRVMAAWGASKAAQILGGWASHLVKDEELPGNAVAIRAANKAMSQAFSAASNAAAAWKYPAKGADRGELALIARDEICKALEIIAAADVEPDPELIAYVKEQQRASHDRAIARFGASQIKIYGESQGQLGRQRENLE